MSLDVRDPLEDMLDAWNRLRTLQVDVVQVVDAHLAHLAAERRAQLDEAGNPPDSIGRIEAPSIAPVAAAVGFGRPMSGRVWWQRPGCWRDELQTVAGTVVVTIIADARSTQIGAPHADARGKSPRDGIATHSGPRPPSRAVAAQGRARINLTVEDRLREIPVMPPTPVTGDWTLSVLEETEHFGRRVTRMRAVTNVLAPGFWMSRIVSEYDCLVDVEFGVLLRCAALHEGREVAVTEARTVRFNETIPGSLFSWTEQK